MRLPAAALPVVSCSTGSGVNASAPLEAVMFAPQVPEQTPATVAVMIAPNLLIVLAANAALVLSVRM